MSQDAAEIARQLPDAERRILRRLREAPDHGRARLDEVAAGAAFENVNAAYSAASWLEKKGLVRITETTERTLELAGEGRAYASSGFPERRVYDYVLQQPGAACTLEALRAAFEPPLVDIALAWWKRKGLGDIEKGTPTTLRARPGVAETPDERLLRLLAQEPLREEAARESEAKALEQLRSRPGVLTVRETKHRFLEATPLGKTVPAEALARDGGLGELSPELIQSGAWRGKEFQAYSLSTAAKREAGAKPHPLAQIIDEVREIFVELGFQEIEEEYVVSAFWNMDALFIPQDHPAREMQDTFYLARPATVAIPDDAFRTYSKVHESGGGTRSTGWGTALDRRESERALLRTHTTVGTVRYLAQHPEPPVRVFSIGRVFRHETMDATHLPEFHQIEGIATEEGADFPMLLGILQEFYRRLGFAKLRWRPAYFPYTEPSMEVEVWTGDEWMELGGCGIFRPEVTLPLGVKTPVLAWGLGLERLAMMRLGLRDIRDLYVSDLEWLRNQPLQ